MKVLRATAEPAISSALRSLAIWIAVASLLALQTVEGEQHPGRLDAIELLPDLGILQKALCDHGSTRHAKLS
jgi:bifunctional DNase/RNase